MDGGIHESSAGLSFIIFQSKTNMNYFLYLHIVCSFLHLPIHSFIQSSVG